MQGRVTIFQSGKMISTGAKGTNQAIQQLNDSMNFMQKNNFIETVHLSPIVRNIVATMNLGKKLNIVSLAQNLSKSIYEPDQFPGLIFKIPDSCTFLIFASGKIVISGAKSEEQLSACAKNIFKLVREFLY